MSAVILGSLVVWCLHDMTQAWLDWLEVRQAHRSVRAYMTFTDTQWQLKVRRRHHRAQRRLAR